MRPNNILDNSFIENKSLFPVTSTINSKGHFVLGGCDTVELVSKYGTPLYIIDEETFTYKAGLYISALNKYYKNSMVLYAGKSFASAAVFKIANKLNLGLDIVSGGELFLAYKAGFNKNNIYFHGNNKSKDELELAITKGIGKIVCDNFYELELLQQLSNKKDKITDILIRLTPGIECHTHEYIKTGHLDSKFGFDLEYFDTILNLLTKQYKNLRLYGFHAHIGSQIFEIKPYCDTAEILLEYFEIAKKKYQLELSEINIGGGIGIEYISEDDPISLDNWANEVSKTIKNKCNKSGLNTPKLLCEPGRSIIGPSGITLYQTGSSKQVPNGRKFISVDGGMADNPRPITYQAKYSAFIANKMNERNVELVTIAGRYCETGDLLIKDIMLPPINSGDIIAVLNTGAYNYSMSSNYNMVPRPACILVKGGNSQIIIEREDYEFISSKHLIPNSL